MFSVRNWVIIRWWTIHEGGRESSRSGSPGQHNRVNTVGVAAAVRSANNSREVAGSLGLAKGMMRAEPKEGDATDDREFDGEEPRDDEYSSMNLDNLTYSTELFGRSLTRRGTTNSKVSGRRGPFGKPNVARWFTFKIRIPIPGSETS